MPIKGEDFVNFCGLLRKHELYQSNIAKWEPDFIKPAKYTLFNNSLNSTGFNQQAVVVGILVNYY